MLPPQNLPNKHMNKQTNIVEQLSQFNNLSFTKKQWDIILKGCGCPKSTHFWNALKKHCMWKASKQFMLTDINNNTMDIIWKEYCENNRTSVKKAYNKAKARQHAIERNNSFKGITFYMVGGALTTEKPERDI